MIPLSIACSSRQPFLYQNDPDAQALSAQEIPYPDARFFILSDTHLYDTSLGVTGPAFQAYLDSDRKLLVLSDEIIQTAVRSIAAQKADFVLVCGDLTKDGEMVCHRAMAEHLKVLKQSGKKIFVVPGNHDILNPDAVRFSENKTEKVAAAGPKEFRSIYHEFGFAEAMAHDDHSLSYVAEPVEGLRLLALDSCRYKDNRPGHHPITGGAFSKQTLAWIEQQLITAKQDGKAVMVMQHHGIMEHYPANKKFYKEYIVDEDETVAGLLGAYGVSMTFTGHFHAQDISRKRSGIGFFLILKPVPWSRPPCPFRKLTLTQGNRVEIKSTAIRSIPSMGNNFAAYADQYVFEGTQKLADAALAKYKVSKDQSALLTPQVAKAYMAHLKGDEIMVKAPIDTQGFGPWLRFVAWMQEDLIHGWWSDLPPADNNIVIRLDTGKVSGLTA